MYVMNPHHRTIANDVLDWMLNAGENIKEKDYDIFLRFFVIGKKENRWDSFVFVDKGVMIGWKNTLYAFYINADSKKVTAFPQDTI
jgi:hypothetical protein